MAVELERTGSPLLAGRLLGEIGEARPVADVAEKNMAFGSSLKLKTGCTNVRSRKLSKLAEKIPDSTRND